MRQPLKNNEMLLSSNISMLDSQTPRAVAAHRRRRAPHGVFCLSCGVPQRLRLALGFDRQICQCGEYLCHDSCSMRFQTSAPLRTKYFCCPILFCWTGLTLTGGWITPVVFWRSVCASYSQIVELFIGGFPGCSFKIASYQIMSIGFFFDI